MGGWRDTEVTAKTSSYSFVMMSERERRAKGREKVLKESLISSAGDDGGSRKSVVCHDFVHDRGWMSNEIFPPFWPRR
jgi:hypothetical protein